MTKVMEWEKEEQGDNRTMIRFERLKAKFWFFHSNLNFFPDMKHDDFYRKRATMYFKISYQGLS